VALAAVIVADLTTNKGMNPVIAILIGLVVATACGAFSGTIIARTGIPPFIVTLGMMTGVRGAALLYTDGKPIPIKDEAVIFLGGGKIGPVPVPIITLIIVIVVAYMMLNNTKVGRHIYALGGNEEAAIISGINVKKLKIMVFSIGGFLAGLAGISLAARIHAGQPSMGLAYELDAIASAVIGGTSLSSGGIGTPQGVIIGAMIIGVINSGMNQLNINSYWQQIVKGAIIIIAVILDMQKVKKGK
jgi:inositol transport system permease protein